MASTDLLPRLATLTGVNTDTLRDWAGLAVKVDPELRHMMSWAAFRAITKRPDWKRLIRPGLSEREARKLAGNTKVRNQSPKEAAEKIRRWWRDPDVRRAVRELDDIEKSLINQLDLLDAEELAELERLAMLGRKNQTPDAKVDDFIAKSFRVTLEIETAVTWIKEGTIRIYPMRVEDLRELGQRLGDAGYDLVIALETPPPPPPDDAIDAEGRLRPPQKELGAGS